MTSPDHTATPAAAQKNRVPAESTNLGAQPLTTERVMGIETEYGVVHADATERSRAGSGASILLSHLTVGAYALLDPAEGERGRRVRWDYGDESPLRDARGFELQRAAAHPTQLTDEVRDAHVPSVELDHALQGPELPPEGEDDEVLSWAVHRSIGNAVLSNGARWYVDHAHPEYCSPEVTRARDAVVMDRAGEVICERAMARLQGAEGIPDVALYKNNTDGKGASYGTHENYLLDRAILFERVCEALIPFLATRQILVGAGRVGLGTRGEEAGFQIASRSDFFEAEIGLETTLNRPIVNTRDEPHADASRHRRLHVIIGDANLLESATFLKLGITSLVLAALEREHRTGEEILPRIELRDPVGAVHLISHDPSLQTRVDLKNGGTVSALEVQQAHCEAIAAVADMNDPETAEVIHQWRDLLHLLATDPARAADRVEWLAKMQLLESYRARHGLAWDDPRLLAIDLQWSDLRPGQGIAAKLRAAGRVRTLVDPTEVERAVTQPPTTTRAYLRGSLIGAHRARVPSAGWDVITLAGEESGVRLRLADPRAGSRAWCEEHGVDPSAPFDDVIAALRAAVDKPAPGGNTPGETMTTGEQSAPLSEEEQ